MNRREFVVTSTASLVASRLTNSKSQRQATRLIMLGTAGGPRPWKTRSSPAQVIVIGDAAYVVDCGDGVVRQLFLAGVPIRNVRQIFITHHHSDHNADYSNLILLGWTAGLRTRVDSWGPPPLVRMTQLMFEMSSADIKARAADEGRASRPLVYAHDLEHGGRVMQDANVRVTAAVVHHPPLVPAFAYRFDSADRSIVISGDTTPSENLVKLARNTDVLVHEALYDAAAVERMIPPGPNASDLRRSILSIHTTAEEAGRIAAEANAKMLVLSHLIPAEDPMITDEMWIDAAAKHFSGRIVVARDLMEL